MLNWSSTFSIPVEALGISDVEVIKVELNRTNEFIITVDSTKKVVMHDFHVKY